VPLIVRLLPLARRSKGVRAALDGANVAALGLMAAVTLQLGKAAIVDVWTALLALIALAALMRFKVNSAWLVLGGGACGLAIKALGA